MSKHFPFSPSAAALLCSWTDDERGIGPIHWSTAPEGVRSLNATVGLVNGRNVLRFDIAPDADEHMAAAAADAATECLREATLSLDDIDVIVAAPAHAGYRAVLADRLAVREDRIVVADDEHTHTASLAAAFQRIAGAVQPGRRALLVAAGAGTVAGAAIYRC